MLVPRVVQEMPIATESGLLCLMLGQFVQALVEAKRTVRTENESPIGGSNNVVITFTVVVVELVVISGFCRFCPKNNICAIYV